MPREFGTEPHRLHRRESPATSRAAAHAVDTNHLEQVVLQAIANHPEGATQDIILGELIGLPYSSVTARFRALLDKGFIKETGDKRPGRSGRLQRVLVANDG